MFFWSKGKYQQFFRVESVGVREDEAERLHHVEDLVEFLFDDDFLLDLVVLDFQVEDGFLVDFELQDL